MSEPLHEQMSRLFDQVRVSVGVRPPPEYASFFVLNPGYHDGKHGSFLVLPDGFCESMLAPYGLTLGQTLSMPGGRLLTVTDRGVVLSFLMKTQRVIHVTCDAPGLLAGGGSDGVTFGSLDGNSRADGWMVPWATFEAAMLDIATRMGLRPSHGQLLKLPAGAVVTGRGGDS